MRLFMTGAGGYIGGTVASALLAAGHRVRGLTRTPAQAQLLSAQGIEPVLGTLDDAQLLTHEARLSDGVINTASADHAGAVNALIAGLEGSGKPLLHTSGSSVIGDDARGKHTTDRVFDEDTPLIVNPAKQARRDIDLSVLAAASRSVRSVVICPSLIYGTGQGLNPHSVQTPFLAAQARLHGKVLIVGSGLNVWSHVHIEDVAQLYLLAINRAPAGAFYFAENGEASFADIGHALAARLNLPGVESLQPELAAERWGEPRAYFSLASNSRVRAVRAKRDLGWSPKHASVIHWIERDMPVDTTSFTPS
jgi:nucleoside-diphosphate-sugar epimerase